MWKEKLTIQGREYLLVVHLERRRDARASIGKKGVNLRIPLNTSREEQAKQIRSLKQWAIKKLEENPMEIKGKGSKTYQDNEILNLRGKEYTVRFLCSNQNRTSVRLKENTVLFNIPSILKEELRKKHISLLLSRLMAKENLVSIQQKVQLLNQNYFNFKLGDVALKYNISNWGSCSPEGNIHLSTRLLFAPEEVIDYVCIHELAHLKEKNHSKNFWSLVKQAIPDYKEKKKWLRQNKDECWF